MTLKQEHARFLGSMFVTVLASQATMVVDAAVGGNLLGADAVSAVDLVMPIYELFYALVMMLGMGGCTVASMCLGRGDLEAVRRYFTAAVVASVCMMVVLVVGICVFKDAVVGLLCGDSYLSGLTHDYLLAMVPYFVIAGISVVFMLFTAMAGRPVLVMWCAVVQFVVNMTCNMMLIKVTGLGIEALAYSSAIAAIATLVMLRPYYKSQDCPFKMVRCSFDELWRALGRNLRYGGGFIAVNIAYVTMVYLMNVLVLRFEGEEGLFCWSVVLMIYLTGDYASSAAQGTSLSLGGRLLGAGDKAGFRMVYNRSLLFAIMWIGLLLVVVFALPEWILPLFGVAEAVAIPDVLRALVLAIPLIVGVSVGNLFLVRLVQQDKVIRYVVLSWAIYLVIPLGYLVLRWLNLSS